MSLPHALLGLLNYKPATGYNLKGAFKSSIQMFWNVSLPQIYRTLNQMEKNGWLASNIENQEGKPNRKIYNVTDKGKKELRAWLKEKPEIPHTKDDLLVKVFFGNQMDREDLVHQIQDRREQSLKFLQKAEKEIEPIVEHYAKLSGANNDARFWLLTLDYGRRRARMVIKWCDAALAAIKK